MAVKFVGADGLCACNLTGFDAQRIRCSAHFEMGACSLLRPEQKPTPPKTLMGINNDALRLLVHQPLSASLTVSGRRHQIQRLVDPANHLARFF